VDTVVLARSTPLRLRRQPVEPSPPPTSTPAIRRHRRAAVLLARLAEVLWNEATPLILDLHALFVDRPRRDPGASTTGWKWLDCSAQRVTPTTASFAGPPGAADLDIRQARTRPSAPDEPDRNTQALASTDPPPRRLQGHNRRG
jgi:hypothetical protein